MYSKLLKVAAAALLSLTTLTALGSDALNNMNSGTDSCKIVELNILVPTCALLLRNNLWTHTFWAMHEKHMTPNQKGVKVHKKKI